MYIDSSSLHSRSVLFCLLELKSSPMVVALSSCPVRFVCLEWTCFQSSSLVYSIYLCLLKKFKMRRNIWDSKCRVSSCNWLRWPETEGNIILLTPTVFACWTIRNPFMKSKLNWLNMLNVGCFVELLGYACMIMLWHVSVDWCQLEGSPIVVAQNDKFDGKQNNGL